MFKIHKCSEQLPPYDEIVLIWGDRLGSWRVWEPAYLSKGYDLDDDIWRGIYGNWTAFTSETDLYWQPMLTTPEEYFKTHCKHGALSASDHCSECVAELHKEEQR